jgi:hypothetical protein
VRCRELGLVHEPISEFLGGHDRFSNRGVEERPKSKAAPNSEQPETSVGIVPTNLIEHPPNVIAG